MTSFDRIVYTTLRIPFTKLTHDIDEDSDLYLAITAATKKAFKEITNYDGIFKSIKEKEPVLKSAPVFKHTKSKITWQDIDDNYVYTTDIQLEGGCYPVKEKNGGIITYAVDDEGNTRWINVNDSKILKVNKIAYRISS